MPDIEENKTVDIDTSGPGAEINVTEEKDEAVVETGSKEQEQETVTKENNEETNQDNNQSDDSLRNLLSSLMFKLAKLKKKMRS